jgi:hypothetical protein
MRFVLKIAMFATAVFAVGQLAISQDIPGGGGDLGTGNNGGVVNNGGAVNNGGTNTNTGNAGPTNATELDLGPEIPEIEDFRRQNGFIGKDVSDLENQTFVGPTIEGITAISGEGQNGGGNAGGGFAGGGGVASGLSFTVNRSSVRARVRPNFSYQTVPTAVAQRNFQGRMNRLPNLRSTVAQGINVTLSGTTATLTGTATNQEAIDNMVGQLRMEPGVYRIVNEVEIAGTIQSIGQSGFSNQGAPSSAILTPAPQIKATPLQVPNTITLSPGPVSILPSVAAGQQR